ncbi:MAG: GNAT family N-acetyltransferase [Gammaproteobacteria bacterium]|nr:GNAT family N-acetyltransferase [Gammaproteobacteria bacterium]
MSGSPAGALPESAKLSIRFVDAIAEIGAEAWNAQTGTGNPFMRYEFLRALESTGCTGPASGWLPRHLALYEGDQCVGVVPLYSKTNSWGEYVFDWSWANAYQQHGLAYYPKLLTAAPFTPSVGRRLFGRAADEPALVCERIRRLALAEGASSWHVLFPADEEVALLRGQGLHIRHGTQFHWRNRGYRSFDDFLASMVSRKRKNLRKERRRVRDQGICFHLTEGADIGEAQWANFYLHYQTTYLQRGMQGYLSQAFFHEIAREMPEQLLLINAEHSGRDIAAALFFHNDETLFGRYWGCREEREFLHFETCYYQGLDYAITKGLRSFDSGAQGEHKIQRGFEPITTHSAHWLANAEFNRAVGRFVEQERSHISEYQQAARTLLPLREERE